MKISLLNKVIFLSITILFISCASTPVTEKTAEIIYSEVTTEENDEIEEIDEVIEVKEPEIPQEVLDFYASLENTNIKIVEAPKYVTVGNTFKIPFKISVTDNQGNPLGNYPISVLVPSGKENNVVVSKVENLKTDENGKLSYMPAKTEFACKTVISFYPTPVNDDPELLEKALLTNKVSADYRVLSDLVRKGAVLFVWDFNEKDKPINNSYELLSEIRSYGIPMVGNAPVNDSSYIGKPVTTLYQENYEIIEDMYGYLIIGTIKFVKPVEPAEDGNGYVCSLIADIKTVNMKNGQEVFSGAYTNETTGSNWNNAVSTCKKQLSAKIAEDLIYGL